MLRFIFRRDRRDEQSSSVWSDHFTADVDAKAVEEILTRGGYGPTGFDRTVLVAVEVLPAIEGGK